METISNNLNERGAQPLARPTHLTVETANTILRLTIDPDTGRLGSRDILTVEGSPPPFVVSLDGKIVYVGIPVERDGSFRVTLSTNISSPTQSDAMILRASGIDAEV
jgi:hypothetical protein